MKSYFVHHLENCGMPRYLLCTGIPKQNGVVERKHRHIVKRGFTLIFHGCFPTYLWPDAFATIVFLTSFT